MKTVIQHTGTARFLTGQGTWTGNPKEALAFLDDVRARDYAFYHEIDRGVPAVLEDHRERASDASASPRSPRRLSEKPIRRNLKHEY